MRDDALVDEAALSRIRVICQRLDGSDEGELQDRPLFRVGRRRFAIFNGATSPPRPRWKSAARSLHFIAAPDELDALRHDERFSESPHHGNRGWLALRLDDPVNADWTEIAELLESAYRQIVGPIR
jgi:predicted DNA-binding protein (MmcQ/YjbR family)